MLYALSKMPTAKLSSQRQITIPKMFLEMIGAKAHDKLTIRLDGKKLVLELAEGDWVERLAGSWTEAMPEDKRGVPFKELLEEAKALAAKEIMKDLS